MPMGAMLAATGAATQEVRHFVFLIVVVYISCLFIYLPLACQRVVEEKEEEEQTAFTVKLVSFADDAKIKVIKEVKTLSEGMNLVQVSKRTQQAFE